MNAFIVVARERALLVLVKKQPSYNVIINKRNIYIRGFFVYFQTSRNERTRGVKINYKLIDIVLLVFFSIRFYAQIP